MTRITFIDIGGKSYPMSFSLGAIRAISDRFGSLEKMSEKLSGEATETGEMFEAVSFIIATLVAQGVAYKNQFENDAPPESDVAYEDGEYVSISQEAIETALDIIALEPAINAISAAMNQGAETEIETEIKKNAAPLAAGN